MQALIFLSFEIKFGWISKKFLMCWNLVSHNGDYEKFSIFWDIHHIVRCKTAGVSEEYVASSFRDEELAK
jgi:hypothetical protein